jgi:TRAP-type C4-dicarboxylate transport system permease small subunit
MGSFRSFVRGLVRVADYAIGVLLIVTVMVNGSAVFMRYVMLDSISWSEEAIRYLAVWITFLGAACASWFDEHLDMNMLGDFGGTWFQTAQKALIQILTAVFAAIVFWQGVRYCWLNGTQTAPTTGLPMLYIYSAIAIGGCLLLLVSLVKVYDAFVPPAPSESGTKVVI